MDVLGGCRGVRGSMIGCGEVSRNGQVSGNGGMGRSGQVIRGASGSDQVSGWTSGHNKQTKRDAERSGQMQRGGQ